MRHLEDSLHISCVRYFAYAHPEQGYYMAIVRSIGDFINETEKYLQQ